MSFLTSLTPALALTCYSTADVLNHLTWAHSDDLLALDASAISNLPEALITEVREYIKKTKAQRKRVTSTAASTSEDERILCPKVGCQNRLGSFKTIGSEIVLTCSTFRTRPANPGLLQPSPPT